MTDVIVWQPGISLDELEKKVILAALKFYRGNKSLTASSLGIAVRTLDNKLALYEEQANKGIYKSPTREEIRDRNESIVKKTGPGGSDHRIVDPERYNNDKHVRTDADGNKQHTTLPGGKLHPDQIAELVARKNAQNGTKAEAGVHVQSVDEVSEKSAVSVSEREKVQAVLPGQITASGGSRQSKALRASAETSASAIHNNKTKGGQ